MADDEGDDMITLLHVNLILLFREMYWQIDLHTGECAASTKATFRMMMHPLTTPLQVTMMIMQHLLVLLLH